MNANGYRLVVYTRRPQPDYSSYLGHSIHFAVGTEEHLNPLFHGYGRLFAECSFSKENGIVSHGIRDITLFRSGSIYIICGIETVRRVENGVTEEKDTGTVLQWSTEDFTVFSGPSRTNAPLDGMDSDGLEQAVPAEPSHLPEGADARVEIRIPQTLADSLLRQNARVRFSSLTLPDTVEISSPGDLDRITAAVHYTDGSLHYKKIKWNVEPLAAGKEAKVHGRIQVRRFPFPVEPHPWGDPVIFYTRGKYYFIATDDTDGNRSFRIREADSPETLFTDTARRSVSTLLDAEHSRFGGTFWAPEFHEIDGKLHIFCALSEKGRGFDPQAHVITLREGGNLMDPSEWDEPKRCVMPDGRFLNQNPLGDGKGGITLDMTCFEAGENHYAVWSYRTWEGCDSGSMLMIARIDPREPWKLTSFPRLLSRPVYAWEHNKVTDNNEGPFAIVTGGMVFLSYSGGSAGEDTYAVGLLTARADADLCDPSVWTKSGTPVLASGFVEGQFGCGHNAFFTDEYGDCYITYHGHDTLKPSPRLVGIRRVHFGRDDVPVFDLSDEDDLPREEEEVTIMVKWK